VVPFLRLLKKSAQLSMRKQILTLTLVLASLGIAAQKEPNHIKSIQLKPLEEKNFSVIVPLGKTLELSFDDLEGDQKDYYYKLQLMNHDWTPSSLISNQYIEGFQSNTILTIQNSFNTRQNYTHYSIRFPNQNTRITKSGNYLLSVLDRDDEVVFNRRFVLYESAAVVGVSVSRGRELKNTNEQQTVNFTVNYPSIRVNNPNQEIHVAILQNQNWRSALTGIQPQFYKPNQLIYRHTNKTNFWGGNEYLFFDNKIIRNASINVQRVERKDVFHNYLYPYKNREVKNYSYNPDINGQYIIRTIEGSDSKTEADYAMMHFTLEVEKEFLNKEVYVYGGFNNFEFTEENRMVFNASTKSYQSNFLLKQGFYNYTFVTRSYDDTISESEIRGNFSKTENEYTVLVYYKALGALFDRVIGVGAITFQGER
tara:strand:+ start:2432 stop:3706 length:1275 start_codon:yes stop_codon:yes gene_type:complete